MKEIRTRYAPSPTGFMHVGNLRSAIFEYLTAKHDGGTFILRIEDTDQERKVEGAVEFIYETLKLCGLNIDEGPSNEGKYGPYVQSERMELYKKYADELVEMGKAYYCFCSEELLDEKRKEAEAAKKPYLYDGTCKRITKEQVMEKINMGEKYVIRQAMPKSGVSVVNDLVYGDITVENKLLEDQVLLKSDGYPTYNFANVIDDHLMNITHVIRGNEYLAQTPKYNLLYEAFGWEKPIYIHLPMVVDEDGKKLSKRHGAASFMDLYKDGYIPQAVVNYLVLLGWSPETTEEIYSLEELIKIFNPARITKSPSIYDVKKLQWINGHYIKKLSLDELLKITVPHLKESYNLADKSDEWVRTLVSIYHNHIAYGKEIVEVTDLFFKDDIELNEECTIFMLQEGVDNTLAIFSEEIKNITEWNVDNIKLAINNTKDKSGVKGKMLFMPIRIKISGQMHGPELPDTIYLLGKETVLKRLTK